MKRIAGFMIGFVAWFVFAHLSFAFVYMRWSWFMEWTPPGRAANLGFALYVGALGTFLVPRWLEKVKPR